MDSPAVEQAFVMDNPAEQKLARDNRELQPVVERAHSADTEQIVATARSVDNSLLPDSSKSDCW
jgi:hypothetical protein